MRTLVRTAAALALIVLLAEVIGIVNRWASKRFANNMAVAVRHKSAQQAQVTVVSVAQEPNGRWPKEMRDPVRVCYSIESFASLASQDRSFYETTERIRQAADGPLCRVAHTHPQADSIKAGDHLDISFTLENGGHISVSSLSRNGQEL